MAQGEQRRNRTKWDFELRRELNRLADLNYAIRYRFAQESIEMEDKNGWKHFNLRLLIAA